MSPAGRGAHRPRDERGAVAVFTAVVSVVLMVVAGLAVDLGNTWARRGQLQVQADRAAVFASQFLPAHTDAQEAVVAQAVAWYLACNPVPGQREMHPEMPVCPTDVRAVTTAAYAGRLLDAVAGPAGSVSFPAPNQVSVTTPTARVEFGLGRAAGAEGTEQQKRATARVNSPGPLAPMALSIDCLLDAGGSLLSGVLPFGYVSTTHKGGGGATPTVTTTWPLAAAAPRLNGLVPGRVTQQLTGTPPSVAVSGSEWPELLPGQRFAVAFARGSGLARVEVQVPGTLVLDGGRNRRRLGQVSVTLPAVVASTAGEWQVKVVTQTVVGSTVTSTAYSSDTSAVDVDPVLAGATPVSCGRLLKSPRAGTQANANFPLNFQHGIDHLIDSWPAAVPQGALDGALLRQVASGAACSGSNGVSVTDTNGNHHGDVPNCVVTMMSNAYEAGFHDGLVGPAGRLTCTQSAPCRPGESVLVDGRLVNDDELLDFVRVPSLLTPATFSDTGRYLSRDAPVTPTSVFDRSIYDSHRFMWVAVVSTLGATSAVQAGDYPVLTFRPVFITGPEAFTDLPLLDPASILGLPGLQPAMATVITTIDTAMRELLQAGVTEQDGLLFDSSGRLSAVRFVTISPDALPAVPADYTGPEAEYVGVGPRIVRLVE
ncbi:pilus assembly protein TadG-related protein [Nocardioides perillae]|uniref:Putative Flp pilus-assembly TadG-like N-terminal domain-containing protein n=1 Tax=Nocardioides perillae TaxID=1119534 RepID=A0A7Y9USS9_9ACTN|nr:hypothetical protein [Nocardioides perillae]